MRYKRKRIPNSFQIRGRLTRTPHNNENVPRMIGEKENKLDMQSITRVPNNPLVIERNHVRLISLSPNKECMM